MFDLINIDPFFLFVAATCVIGAIGALESKEIVYGGIFLGIFLVGIAEAFILLGSSLIGLFQIVIYVGAVAVLILFTMLLVKRDPQEGEEIRPKDNRGKIEAVVGVITGASIIFAISLVIALIGSENLLIPTVTETNVLELATSVFIEYRVVVILLPIVLVTSLIGSFLLMSYDPLGEESSTDQTNSTGSTNQENSGGDPQ
ncbi:MAG: NADH-quinone oxidoreductase subunit J family protein [Candidatus Ranarchaeia archaeon]|jgi:NADH-quinone oxidoreductase subunit J